jgi:predicted DNA-binding transcriptional regulator YafY
MAHDDDLAPATVLGTTERVLKLLGLLQRRTVWTGPELARSLGVTTRSVRRDVERLRRLGYPVEAGPGVGGGYRLGAGRALPPLLLDDEEAVATAVSLRLAAGGTVAGASEAALRTLAKLDQVLPARLRAEVRTLHDAISVLDGGREVVDAEVLMGLARATRDRVRVGLGYVDRAGAATQRRVEPYGLVATGRRWYLMCFDLERDDWRSFRLDRISRIEVSTWRFAAREHPDPADYVQRAVTSEVYRYRAVVRVQAAADLVRQRVTPSAMLVEDLDAETCLVRAGADDLGFLALHLGCLGFDFEVLEPMALRDEVAAMADRLARAARG